MDTYFFARRARNGSAEPTASITKSPIQIQRIYDSAHPDPIFNVERASGARNKLRALRNVGSNTPSFSLAHYHDDRSVEVAHVSAEVIAFDPACTPCLVPDSSVRTVRMSVPSSFVDPIFTQPVVWELRARDNDGWQIKSDKAESRPDQAFDLVDCSTNTILASWHFSKDHWELLRHGVVVARFKGGHLQVARDQADVFVDEHCRRLRIKQARRMSLSQGAGGSLRSTSRSSTLSTMVYRAKFGDGLIFSTVALVLALEKSRELRGGLSLWRSLSSWRKTKT